ncbi:helix-turn-helix transcriptional regulator [Niabella aquatica]
MRDDLFILEGRYQLQDDVAISGEGDNDLLEIQFNLSQLDIVYRNKRNVEQVAPAGSGNIAFLPAAENKARIFFKKDVVYNTFDIHLPVNGLHNYAGESKLMDAFLENIQSSALATFSPNTVEITPAIYNAIQDVKNCSYQGLTRKIYLESKAYELIALINEQAESRKTDHNLNRADQERIREAAAIIRNNLERPCSIIDLARMVGINQTKLKSGFKSIFDNTVFGYLQEVRMHQAKKHLLDTQLSVQEISLLLGYQNTSNFSSAFKKIHGFSPMKLRKNDATVQ